jgi:hypothetical protein
VLETGEQFALRFSHFHGDLGVRFRPSCLLQLIHSHLRSQESGQAGQLPQDLPRRRIPTVDTLLFALGRHGHFRHPARPVKVQIGVEVLSVELIESFRVRRADVTVTDVLPDRRRLAVDFATPTTRPMSWLADKAGT